MKIILLFVVLLFCATADNWAVLVAGSNTYANYRHQSDVFHAYQILMKNNFNPQNIITFAYDDIANNIKNPFKGKVFNKPTNKEPGVDVYAGVKIDYKGKDVMPENFLHVLEGNKTAMSGKGTGRVLESTTDDNVFLYFADHGAPGLIAFPSKYLYADQLMATFKKMEGHFKKFVFYLEACQSGSMFTNLSTSTKMYALSAANPKQSSWGTYCSPNDVVQGKHIGSCLGDLFSINFLENTQSVNVKTMTLEEQFKVIQKLTTKSHVMQWGDLSFTEDTLQEYLAGTPSSSMMLSAKRGIGKLWQRKSLFSVDSRYVKITTLTEIFKRQKTQESYEEMREEMASMQRLDKIFKPFILAHKLTGDYNPEQIHFDCLRQVMNSFEEKCGRLSDYGLVYVKYISQGCEKIDAKEIMQGLVC